MSSRLAGMEYHVSLIGRKDLSGEIYRQLRRGILEGRLRPGDALPPTRTLARSLNVSRTTVSVAYDRLLGEGFATSRVGSGTFVGERGPRRGQRRAAERSARRAQSAGHLGFDPATDGLPSSSPIRFPFRYSRRITLSTQGVAPPACRRAASGGLPQGGLWACRRPSRVARGDRSTHRAVAWSGRVGGRRHDHQWHPTSARCDREDSSRAGRSGCRRRIPAIRRRESCSRRSARE